MSECVFCMIASGKIKDARVYEDKKCIAFLDIAPANKGHLLVIPKEHAETIKDANQDSLDAVIGVVKKIVAALLREYDGVNIMQNNGKAAGQAVNHLHFHLIPRKVDDNLDIIPKRTQKYADGEMAAMQDKIKKLLK